MLGNYSLHSLYKGIREPSLAVNELQRLYKLGGLRLSQNYYTWRYGDRGIDVMARDWDNLLILDAARPELTAECDLPEAWQLSTITSPASESHGFMQATWEGKQFYDTVYVTSNPHAYKLPSDTFHYVENLLDSEWDKELMTVTPADVVKRASEIIEMYPDKRLIVHFMQPHFPFLSEAGQQIDDSGITVHLDNDEEIERGSQPWQKIESGSLEPDVVVEAYQENHALAISYAEELVCQLTGKTVITADHANLLGERLAPLYIQKYGHPKDLPAPSLTTVPWIDVPCDTRRRIISDPPKSDENTNAKIVDDRLQALGYVPDQTAEK